MQRNNLILLKTKRLFLRNLRKEDSISIKKNITKEVIKWLPSIPWPYTLDNANDYIKESIRNFKKGKAYDFGIIFNKKLIGTISLYEIDRINQRAGLAYLLNRKYWNRGIMSEAVERVLLFGFNELNLKKIFTKVIAENKKSLKLLSKFKFNVDGINPKHHYLRGKFYDEIILSLLKEKYEKTKKC
ncbi:MAG: GNAT family N-acetyltransferase [Candidatus Woesearchaeota archaeon]